MYGCLVIIAIIAVQCYAVEYHPSCASSLWTHYLTYWEHYDYHALISVIITSFMPSRALIYWVVYQHQKLKISSVDVLHQSVQLQLNSNYCQYSLCDCAKSLETSYCKGGWEISILVAAITMYRWHWSVCEEISLWSSRIHRTRITNILVLVWLLSTRDSAIS